MQNRFGLKDFLLYILIIGLGVLVFMTMHQDDRRFRQLDQFSQQATEQQQTLVAIRTQLDDQRRALVDLTEAINSLRVEGVTISSGSASTTPGQMGDDSRDESWARPGIAVTWSPEWKFTTDPRQQGGVPGGEFVELYEGQPPTLTPYRYADVYGRRLNDLVCESLGWYDPVSLRMRGRLAQAWQLDPEGKWLRVKIHPRARFSDGVPVTAEDVRWTVDEVLNNPEIEADRFRSVYNSFEKVQVVDEKVVEFTFTSPRFDNLDKAFGFKVIPKHFYEDFVRTPSRYNESTALLLGSGPYKLRRLDPENQWTPPNDIVLVRNEAYWADCKPLLAGYRIKCIQDSLARLTAYTNGDGDMMRPTPEQVDRKRTDREFTEKHDIKVWPNMRGGYSFVAWQCGPRNGKLTPFHDARVRMAMTHIIDRHRVLRDIYKGQGGIATGPFNSTTPTANPEVEPWPYDPERGAELLAEAGWIDRDDDGVLENEAGDEFEFEIKFGSGSESTLQFVTYVSQACADSGIRCELRPIDWSILQETLNGRDFDAITFAWSASAPESDPEQIWHSKWIENQGDNFVQWNSPDADRLIEAGQRELDFDKRMKIWHQLHEVFHREQPYSFMIELPWRRFVSKRSENVQEYASGVEYYEFWMNPSAAQMP